MHTLAQRHLFSCIQKIVVDIRCERCIHLDKEPSFIQDVVEILVLGDMYILTRRVPATVLSMR